MKKLALALLLALSMTAAVAEEDVKNLVKTDQLELNVLSDFEAGSRRAMAGDHEMARVFFEQGVKKGDARCMFGIGTQYYFGEGVDQDFKEAHKWLEMSVEKGYSPSAFVLSQMYRKGEGVDPDADKANELLNLAASRCVAQAQLELAGRLREGDGVPQDMVSAIAWLMIAGSNEDSDDDTRTIVSEVQSTMEEDLRIEVAAREKEHRAALNCPAD